MGKDDTAALRIEALVAGGMGLARLEGRPIFTEFTAPGDLVRVRIREEQKTWAKAELLEVLEPSPERIDHVCPFYRRCGGCSFQHLNYEAQLKAKEAILRESFSRIGGITGPGSLPAIKVRRSSPWEYRNRVQFHCIPGQRKVVGFKSRKGREVIPLEDCPVADPGIREALKTRDSKRLSPPPQKDRFTVFSWGSHFLSEGGTPRGVIELSGKTLCIDAGVFFQSNIAMLELLIEDLKTLADTADSRFPLGDFYCGVGTFTAFLGERFSQVELVEENRDAIALAIQNTGAKGRQFFALSDQEWLKARKPRHTKWGLLVVDPPREGLSKSLRHYLAASETKTLAYVSCDPVTLSRDSKDIIAAGFCLKELYLYDFYPQTSHIESLAVFYLK
jgi:23S rRNA (uracil1939-C5)-methyltransferase